MRAWREHRAIEPIAIAGDAEDEEILAIKSRRSTASDATPVGPAQIPSVRARSRCISDPDATIA